MSLNIVLLIDCTANMAQHSNVVLGMLNSFIGDQSAVIDDSRISIAVVNSEIKTLYYYAKADTLRLVDKLEFCGSSHIQDALESILNDLKEVKDTLVLVISSNMIYETENIKKFQHDGGFLIHFDDLASCDTQTIRYMMERSDNLHGGQKDPFMGCERDLLPLECPPTKITLSDVEALIAEHESFSLLPPPILQRRQTFGNCNE